MLDTELLRWKADASLAKSDELFRCANALIARAKTPRADPEDQTSEELFSAFQNACDAAAIRFSDRTANAIEAYRRSLIAWANELFGQRNTTHPTEKRDEAALDRAALRTAVREELGFGSLRRP